MLKSFKCPEAIQSLRPTYTARAAADPRARRKSDEEKFESVEEAREAAVEVAQEEDAPPEEGPEAAAAVMMQGRRAAGSDGWSFPFCHSAFLPAASESVVPYMGAWGSGILTGSSYDVKSIKTLSGVRG